MEPDVFPGDTLSVLNYRFLLCYAASIGFATALSAETPWEGAIRNQGLAGVARLLSQPNATPWPELSSAPSTLGLEIHAKIKQLEGAQPPDIAAIPDRVRLYADLARRFRAAHGYANYVLADTLQILSVLHLTRLVTSDPGRAAECAALLQSLEFPLLTPEIFKEIYRAKVGTSVSLDSDTQEQMLATMKRLGDSEDGMLPISLAALRSSDTGALLTRANPPGFLFRLSTTEIMGRGALPELIEFLSKGGRLIDVNQADVRNYQSVIPADYQPRRFGVLAAAVGTSQVRQLIDSADDPNFALLLWALDGPRRKAQSRFRVKETALGKVGGFEEGFLMGISPDGARYSVVAKRGSQRVLLTELGESRPYDDIRGVLYNPQGTRLAFIGRRAEQEFVILDGVESQPYERVPESEVQFSSDGRHAAFLGIRGHQFFVVTDGRASAPLPDVMGLSFSPGQQLAYMVLSGRRWTVAYGQHRSREYERMNGPAGITFSPDGKYWIYQVNDLQGQSRVILEGERRAEFPARELYGRPVFSPDGRRVAWRMHAAEPDFVDVQLLDLDRPAAPRTIHANEVFFSSDLRRYATVDLTSPVNGANRTYGVTIDGRVYPATGFSVPTVTFSPRGTHFAIGGDQPLFDGTALPAGQHISDPVFSSDESSYAYTASIRTASETRDVIVHDGRQIRAFPPSVGRYPMAFSPDNRHLAYAASYDPLHWTLGVDGDEATPTYDFIPYQSRLIFNAPNRFHTIAVRGDDTLLVEVSWE